jgi:hypothetical protein
MDSDAMWPDEAQDRTLDGNAIGGLLAEVFGTEMTAAVGTCGSCGTAGPVAEMMVFRSAMGTVARCRVCEGVLMVVVRSFGLYCVDLQGLTDLR